MCVLHNFDKNLHTGNFFFLFVFHLLHEIMCERVGTRNVTVCPKGPVNWLLTPDSDLDLGQGNPNPASETLFYHALPFCEVQ